MKDLRIIRDYTICSTHSEMELKYLCKDDDRLCCNTCLLTCHRRCQKVDELKGDALETQVKSETEKLKDSVNKLSLFAKSIIDAKVKNTKDNEAVPENIRKTVQDLRTKIINILDSFEETAIEQAKAIVKNVKLSEEKDVETLKAAIIDMGACLSLTDTATKYGTISHSYVALEKTKETFKKYEHVITNIADALENVTPVLKLENEMQSFVDLGPNDTNTLGKVIEKRLDVSVPLYQSCALLRDYRITKTTEKSIKENYKGSNSPTYSHLTFLPNDCAFLVDTYNDYCSVTNDRYDTVASLKIAVRSSSYMKDGTVAVNALYERKISFLSTNKEMKIMGEMKIKRTPVAVQGLGNGSIAVAWKGPVAFGIILPDKTTTETVYFCKDKQGRELKSFSHMAIDEERKQVIQPCTIDKAVYCFDYEGYPKFTFTNAKLTNPKGVALDRDENIYVCSYTEPAIHVISPAGRAIKVISEGCPKGPLAIAFKKNGEEFAVTQCNDYRLVTFFKLRRQ